MFIDPLYLVIILPAIIFGLAASLAFRYWANKYTNTPNSKNLTGYDTIQKLSNKYKIPITLARTDNDFGDHFNPRNNELTLSTQVADKPTIASIAIAAHEYGHVRQSVEQKYLMNLRKILVPFVNIGTNVGYILIIIGLLLVWAELAWLGIVFFSASTIFALFTVPIEIDASTKAVNMIRTEGLLDDSEIGAAKKVLFGASLTYIAALFSSLANLLYFVIRVDNIRRN